MTDENDEYPEHTKLKAVNDETQVAYDFYEWLSTRGIFLAEMDDGRIYPTMTSIDALLAVWKNIDLRKIDEEKRAMLAKIRADAEAPRCLICKRVLNNAADPLSEDCGGDCVGCIKEAEGR